MSFDKRLSIYVVSLFLCFALVACEDNSDTGEDGAADLTRHDPVIREFFSNFEYSGTIYEGHHDEACKFVGQTYTLIVEIDGSMTCTNVGNQEADCTAAFSITWPLTGELRVGEEEAISLSGSVDRLSNEGLFDAVIRLDSSVYGGEFGAGFFDSFDGVTKPEELNWSFAAEDGNGWVRCVLDIEN